MHHVQKVRQVRPTFLLAMHVEEVGVVRREVHILFDVVLHEAVWLISGFFQTCV